MTTYQQRYNQTPMGKYIRQRANAQNRGIPWDFTFDSWWKIWQDSGKWEERGNGRFGYCMARINDEGHYCPENVVIKTLQDNTLEYLASRWDSKQTSTDAPYPRTSAWEYTVNGVPVNRIEEKA